ncbi:hypothetical protein I600_525 [Maribacter dokdonensis DSW-8]|nr:hypothetical protein I600_525 [Maribacter dokdonensis DSW-8]
MVSTFLTFISKRGKSVNEGYLLTSRVVPYTMYPLLFKCMPIAFPIPEDPPVISTTFVFILKKISDAKFYIELILNILPKFKFFHFWVQKKASYLHRTATTVYPCCVPTLGDSTGAGRVGLAGCKYTIF